MDLHVARPGIVLPVRTDTAGVAGPTPQQVRSKRWRRTSPGLYVPADTSRDCTFQRIVEAAAGGADGSAVTGWAALHWQGAQWFEGRTRAAALLPVPLALGDTGILSRRRGVQFCHDWLFDDDVVQVDGLPLTRPERSVCVAALRARTVEETVQVVDMACASDLVSLDEVAAYAERLRGRPHTRRLFSAIALGDENVWSPMEVTMRLRWIAHHDTPLLCNAPIFAEDGRHLLTPDLFDPQTGVAGEYDGIVHERTGVRRRDLDRENLARAYGIEVVSMISTDLQDLVNFERRLDDAYGRTARATGLPRWTLDQPPGWVDTSTVEKRRALSSEDRERWLRRRSVGPTPHGKSLGPATETNDFPWGVGAGGVETRLGP